MDNPECARCPRLRAYCASLPERKAFAGETYWRKPVPSFGPADASLLVVGLAPAAHGANRTGRMFTGDRSGEWLYRALYRAGFANQPQSAHAQDGLQLRNARVTAAAHCAPPDNKPLPDELRACRPYLEDELAHPALRVVIALGRIAFDSTWRILGKGPPPHFSHGSEIPLASGRTLLLSYHPSQQNTFTKKLTEPMLDSVFFRAGLLCGNLESGLLSGSLAHHPKHLNDLKSTPLDVLKASFVPE